jgi:hypothetical protein
LQSFIPILSAKIEIIIMKEQVVYSSPIANQLEAEQNQILCEELAMLNEMLPPDTEILPETAAGNTERMWV